MQMFNTQSSTQEKKDTPLTKMLTNLGFKSDTKYCSVHKKYYGCIVDIKTGESTECPICEEELEKQIRAKAMMYSNIDGLTKRYVNASFKNYVTKTELQKKIFSVVLNYAKNPNNKWLILLGANGTGKTHLAHAILKCTGGIYREFDEIASELLDAQAKSKGEVSEIINRYSTSKMLIIDEIDKVKATDGRIRWLNIILRRRYNELLPIVILGNTDIDTICNSIDLQGNQAIKDRIREVGLILNLNWKSYRIST